MPNLFELFERPSVRYPLMSFTAALALSTSLTGLPILAALGFSFGVGMIVSMGVRISLYLKEIGDEAKATLKEMHDTISEVKKTITNTEATLKEFSNSAKALQEHLKINPEISQHTLAETLTETLVELKQTAKSLNDNLAFDKEKGEKPLGEQLKETLQTVDKTVAEVNDTIENSRQGWAGWVIGANKPKAKLTEKALATKESAKKTSDEKAPETASPEKTAGDAPSNPGENQTPGWISNPFKGAYWGYKSQAAPSATPAAKPVTPKTRSSRRLAAKQ